MSNWYTKPQGGWLFNNNSLSNNTGETSSLHYAGNSKTFFTNKTYLYRTKIRNLKTLSTNGIRIGTPWFINFRNISFSNLSENDGYINFYSKPTIRIDSTNNPDRFTGQVIGQGFVDHYSYISYTNESGNSFGPTSGVMHVDIKELDWNLHGYSWIESTGLTSGSILSNTNKGKGWSYNSNDSEYFEYFSTSGGVNPAANSLTQSQISNDFIEINHLSRYVEFNFFNLYFTTTIQGVGFNVYLSDNEPYIGSSTQSFASWKNSADLIASYSTASVPSGQTFSAFFGLKGNKYVSIVADNPGSTNTSIRLFGLKVEGGYGEGNNRQYLISATSSESNFESSGLSGVTFSSFVGIGDTYNDGNDPQVSQIFSRIGNGSFNAGMWENGVWNNGWRVDNSVREFDDIDLSIKTRSDVRWRFRIIGPSASVSNFELGDEITIGNIVAIDINEKRRFIKDRFRITGINQTGINERIGFIVVEVDTTFPVRRIEKDSKNHRIKITKNGWLSGAFLNGYFTGVWNFGLFKGYPLITEMFDTNWIDGLFDGGHFQSEYYISGTFSDVIFRDNKVGLKFSTPHKLTVGDIIEIEMDGDNENPVVNPNYNGEARVVQVISDDEIITDIDYGVKKLGGLEGGKFTTEISTSVIQNMDFNSNNISKTTSIDSLNTEDVFIYNSWIDVNYSNQSAVNIGRPQTKINEASRKSFSENNLYGYPTNDVLSSNSKFRDSYTLTDRDYKLGNKWRLFSDYVGESSKFTEFFGTSSEDTQLFIDQGWTFSKYSTNSITFSRTNDEGIKDISGEELKVEAILKGGVLDINQPTLNINSRNLEKIEKDRYTVIEFDLVTYSVIEKSNGKFNLPSDLIYEPFIHFNNVNKTKRDVLFFNGVIKDDIPAEYLPVYRNIEHLETKKKRKIEFFFNKRNLSMNFTGGGVFNSSKSEYILNNLKIYEVDMIPFFQYFIDININRSIQIPFQGIAPYIDYESSDFSFIDNINIGLDSTSIESTSELFTGVGQGIVSGGLGGIVGISFPSSPSVIGVFDIGTFN